MALATVALTAAWADANNDKRKVSVLSRIVYDGITDDLLTGGLGKDGLAATAAPTFADPLNPTVAELRRLAIYGNYRALIDTTDGGGYGRLYGPNVTADGTVTSDPGLVPGIEVIAFAGDASGHVNVTMMVQIPDNFDPDEPCIVTAPSSGSRGVYGAIGTAGEWGLKNGCVVAYTDKGTGTGAHNLQLDTVGLFDGTRVSADEAGKDSTFTAKVSRKKLARFNAETPDRFAFKHAHSQQNPEKDWGRNVLDSIEFAFHVLNAEFPSHYFEPDNTIVIASSVSNGGGSSVRAAEQDRKGLIDGVVVSEPNVNPEPSEAFTIVQGGAAPFADHSKGLLDYYTLQNVYQGCANAAPSLAFAPFNFAPSPERCASLYDLGLLQADNLADQTAEAQAILNDFGFLTEQNILAPSHWTINVPQGIAVTYANTYGRFSVFENTCGYSFGATDAGGIPVLLSAAAEAALFSSSNGIPPTAGVNLINNLAPGPGGAAENRVSTLDQNLEGAICLRALATGRDPVTGERLRGQDRAMHRKILKGIRQVRASGDLRGVPAIFVTGRDDAVLPPNHTSRAYFGLNNVVEGGSSNLRYVEVLNAQHLDVLNSLVAFGFADRWIPLHHYYVQAADLMLDHLRNGTPLPPSQVVRTTPRGPGAPPVTVALNLPPISAAPDPGSLIIFDGQAVRIPD
jgi:hydroxybutyrate-dimer hydrolase